MNEKGPKATTDELERRIKDYENRPASEQEEMEKSSLEDIKRVLDKGEEQPVAQPVERIDGAFSN